MLLSVEGIGVFFKMLMGRTVFIYVRVKLICFDVEDEFETS